jgi:urease accessory protein
MDAPAIVITRMVAPQSARPSAAQCVIEVERRVFLKRRWRATAPDGTDFGFDLEERLADGCVVFQSPERDYVVRQARETVYEIPFTSPEHAALVAWKTGNLHLPAEILPDRIRVLHDESMGQLLAREGWAHAEPVVVFRPLKAMAHEV